MVIIHCSDESVEKHIQLISSVITAPISSAVEWPESSDCLPATPHPSHAVLLEFPNQLSPVIILSLSDLALQ